MTRSILLLLALVALGSGCRKPLPSPDYIEASNHYTSLLAVQGDEAYSAPAMDEVIAQLGRVSPKSSDYGAAVTLIATIAQERGRVAAAAEALKVAAAVPPSNPTFPSFPPVAAAEQAVAAAPTPDAAVNELAIGADFNALQAKYVGCLLPQGTIKIASAKGITSDTEGYELHDSASCRSRIPGLGTNVLLVRAGKIAFIFPKSALRVTTTLEDGGPVPAP